MAVPKQGVTPAKRVALTSLLVATSTVVALLFCEVLIRIVAPVPMIPQMFSSDPYTLFRMKPNTSERSTLSGDVEWGWKTNSVGFRGSQEYAIPKPRGTRRVLALGDSFTFGFGVDDDQAYPAVLQRLLDSACAGIPVEVVNAGVSGFSTSQELAMLEHEGTALAPDVVLIGFFVNDPQDNIDKAVHSLAGDSLVSAQPAAGSAYEGVGRAKAIINAIPGYEWLARNSMLVNWLRRVYFASREQDAAAHPARWGMGSGPGAPMDTAALGTQWWLMDVLFARIRERSSTIGSALVVALLPDDSTAARYAGGRPTAAQTFGRMRRVCERLRLACVDVAEAIGAKVDVSRISVLYLAGEGHFSALGHRLTAEALAPAVERSLNCRPNPHPKAEHALPTTLGRSANYAEGVRVSH